MAGRPRGGAARPGGILTALGQSGEIEILAGAVGRFYGDGLRWALTLPLPALLRWSEIMPQIMRREHGG